MTLLEATAKASAALEAGDLGALAGALEARRKAMNSGEKPTVEDYDAGQRMLRVLLEFQKRAAYESARLGQIKQYVDFRKDLRP